MPKEYEITSSIQITYKLSKGDLAKLILAEACELMGVQEPAVLYGTDEKGWVYINNDPERLVSNNPNAGVLIDAYNLLWRREVVKLKKS